MIDEKKIEEAANEAATKYGGSYVDLDYLVGFRDGINWFLGNLWHTASEEPKKDEECLLKAIFTNDDGYTLQAYVTSTYGVNGWNEDFFPRGYDLVEVKEYAYIEDLLKGGK